MYVQETGIYRDTIVASVDYQPEPKTVQELSDHIENQKLYHVLLIVLSLPYRLFL